MLAPIIEKETDGKLPPHETLEKIISVGRTRASTLADFVTQGKFFFHLPDYEANLLVWKNVPFKEVVDVLKEVHRAFADIAAADFHERAFE